MGFIDRFKRNAGKSPRRAEPDAEAGTQPTTTRRTVRKSPGDGDEAAEVSTYVVPAPQTSRRGELLGSAAARVATWSWRFLLIIAALVVLTFAIGQLWVVVLPLLLGLLLATVLWPPARLLRRWLPAALASLLVIVGGLLVLFGLGAVL
ncbi:MAG TPA: hypothetical protein VHG70_15250, partial [Nocardioidaceae bacterium]|nr:hypothetical protein [Nocardioidaceae bacterium]